MRTFLVDTNQMVLTLYMSGKGSNTAGNACVWTYIIAYAQCKMIGMKNTCMHYASMCF
jgi:hypothetical protein